VRLGRTDCVRPLASALLRYTGENGLATAKSFRWQFESTLVINRYRRQDQRRINGKRFGIRGIEPDRTQWTAAPLLTHLKQLKAPSTSVSSSTMMCCGALGTTN
jgi:hypothetical protein